ncbi:kinase-like domain-containing protein [Hypoxylon sp. FL1150]|nr:kinase-like domain-containing protein [Hypoxylon sp. FL1150]
MSMASILYDEILTDLYNQIHRKLERSDLADQRFAKVGTAQEVLAPFNLKRLFCSLVPSGDSLEDHFGRDITVDVLVSRTEERSLQNFLAILIYARCSVKSARGFVTKLLIPSEYDGFNHLPAEREQLDHVFGTENTPDIISFMDTQSCFCPIVLYEGEDVQVADGKKQRLPYVSDPKYIDTGSYGIVYSVVIAKGHLANRHTHMANTEAKPMARKDFKKVNELHKEYEIMKRILHTPRKSNNIVETFGSLQLDETTFSLFMPLAECDLRVWMKEHNPPIFESKKADILMCASGLADGLEFLHSEIRDSNGNKMVCYHMDLKPANILVFPDDREPGKMIWKISDFGMSRVKMSHRHATLDDTDISVLFEKRGGETSASGTVNRRFEATYLAPESSISMRTMNEKSDVWSLGCVISVVLTYLSEGQAGIEQYSEDRATISQRSGAGNMDRFFLVGRSLTQLKPHPAISKHHKHLIGKANQGRPGEGRLIENVLKYIEEKVLHLEPDRRVSAESVRDKLLNASAYYQMLSDNDDGHDDHDHLGNRALSWWQKPFHR